VKILFRGFVRNRAHSYCGAAKQMKMAWTHLEEGWRTLGEKCTTWVEGPSEEEDI